MRVLAAFGAREQGESADYTILRLTMLELLPRLTWRQREIVKLRYGIGEEFTYSLREVGRIFKVTQERVRIVQAKAILELQRLDRIADQSRPLERNEQGDLPQGCPRIALRGEGGWTRRDQRNDATWRKHRPHSGPRSTND